LGMGSREERMAAANSIIGDYQLLMQSPFADMVTREGVFNALKLKYNAIDIKNIDEYLVEPSDDEQPQEPQPDPEMMKVQAEMQMKQQAQQFEQDMKAQAQEFDQALAEQRAIFEAQLAIDKAAAEAELAGWKAAQEAAKRVELSKNRPGGDLDK
jgi:DNA-binding transcriptional MerR regulator